MNCVNNWLQEWKLLNIQSTPGYLFYFLDRLYWILLYSIVGYFGKGNLGAVVVALGLYNLCNIVLEGILSSFLLLLRSTKGDRKLENYWVSIACVIVLCSVCLTCAVFILFNFVFYYYLGLNPNVKLKAIQFSWLLFPAFLFDGLQKVFQQLLIYRGHIYHACIALGLGIISNVSFCILFLYLFQMGPRGAALSISCSKVIIFLLLGYFCRHVLHISDVYSNPLGYFRRIIRKTLSPHKNKKSPDIHPETEMVNIVADNGLEEKNDIEENDDVDGEDEHSSSKLEAQPLNPEETDSINSPIKYNERRVNDIVKHFILSIPRIIMIVVDLYPYELLALIIGNMGNVPLGTNQMLIITIQFLTTIFVFPMNVTASNRIYYSLLNDKVEEAKYTAFVCFVQTAIYGCFAGIIYYFFWDSLGYLYTGNQDIVKRMSSMMLFATIFFFLYSFQITLSGILKGLGYQMEILGLSFLSVWCVGFPVGIYLDFFSMPPYGLEGLWFGMILGVSLQVIVLFFLVICTDWKKESRRIKFMNRSVEKLLNNISFGDVILPYVGSRAIGGFLIQFRTLEDEILELEAVELLTEENPLL